jgi:hypothetical protein
MFVLRLPKYPRHFASNRGAPPQKAIWISMAVDHLEITSLLIARDLDMLPRV